MADRQWRPWRAAMQSALYGPHGFYVRTGAPARHFRTAAHASPLWGQAILELARQVDEALGHPTGFTVVDVGAGGGELLARLADGAPDRWGLVGVDLAPAPAALPRRVRWTSTPPAGVTGLLLAVELLDVVPVEVVERTQRGLRLVEVDAAGVERATLPPAERDVRWLRQWWPIRQIGDRAEVGSPRDEAWRRLAATVARGVAVAVDYAAEPARDVSGTLTGYRDGRQVRPVPDGSCDLTAHVLFESLTAATDVVLSQRDALRALGLSAARPRLGTDTPSYLAGLTAAGEAAELLDPDGLGAFRWLLRAVACDLRWVNGPPAEGPAAAAPPVRPP